MLFLFFFDDTYRFNYQAVQIIVMKVMNGIDVVQVQQVRIHTDTKSPIIFFCPLETRSVSTTRYLDPSEPVRGPSGDNFVIILLFSII